MDFDLSDDQKMLVDTAQTFVKKESPIGRARKLRDDETGWDRAAWKKMGELGWMSLPFPESVGGFGGSFAEVLLIIDQLGTTLVPEPYVESVLLAGVAILRAGTAAQQERLLTPMIAGETSLALAALERGSRYDVTCVDTRAEKRGDGWALTGEKFFVLNGHAADHLVVSARSSGKAGDRNGLSLFAVPKGAPGLRTQRVKTMDGRHAAILTLEKVDAELLGSEGAAAPVLDEVMDLGAAAACAEGCGIMRTVLWMTVEYLRTREQFGVKIGTFQALQHRAVDMFIETELAKSTSMLAMIKSNASADERAYEISKAKVQLTASGHFVVREGTQLHGGIGVTDEHDLGLYFKRMQVLGALFGDEDFHLQRFSSMPQFAAL
jgi:alkylation response protein AidB-like acyl-CoA dehydrogenase